MIYYLLINSDFHLTGNLLVLKHIVHYNAFYFCSANDMYRILAFLFNGSMMVPILSLVVLSFVEVELAKKWLKLTQSGKTPICLVWRVRVKRLAKIAGSSKRKFFCHSFYLFIYFFSTFNEKSWKIKAFLDVSLVNLCY